MDFNKLTIKARRRSPPRRSWRAGAGTRRSTPSICCSRCSTRSSSPTGRGCAPRPSRSSPRGPSASGAREPPAARLERARSGARRGRRASAKQLEDDYVSTEHLFLALEPVPREEILAWIKKVRGGQRVTSQDPEGSYQALEKFGRDLTEAAEDGQARPGDRPRRGDPPRDPDPLAAHEEQPGPDRRARRRQDRDRRGPRAADRRRRRARRAEGPRASGRSTSARCSPARSTAASSRSG